MIQNLLVAARQAVDVSFQLHLDLTQRPFG
jgi:hypothetical protein